jgi:hypothetical protein
MAIVAKMQASEIKALGGGRYVACDPDEEGAIAADDKSSPIANLYTDLPGWLAGATHFRRQAHAQSSECITLTCVSMPAGSDPDQTNAQWAMASPSGQLTMQIHNPEAFGYVQAGREYRVTIERIRGPKDRD